MPQHAMVPTAPLKADPGQARGDRDPEKQRQLNESVAQHGVLQPIGVRYDRVHVVWGLGRLIAAVAAGLKEIPAVVLDEAMADWQCRSLSLVENVVRSDLTQFQLWQSCLALLQDRPDWGLGDLAKALSYDASSITRVMSPSKIIPDAVEALREAKINLGHTYAISKAGDPESQRGILSLCLSGATRDAAEKAVRKLKSAAAPAAAAVKADRVKIATKEATVVVTGTDLCMLSLVELLSEVLKEARKSADQFDIKTWQRMMADKAKA